VERAEDIEVAEESFQVFDGSGASTERSVWRTIGRSGNFAESYISVAPNGVIYDFGGNYLTFSSDEGRTWFRVLPNRSMFGEGAVALAPGGDVVGVGWDVGTDTVLSFRLDRSEGRWDYGSVPVRQPFFDRPTIAVLPGPFHIEGEKFPYVSMLRGGSAWTGKTPWLYSLDGITYDRPSSRFLDQIQGSVVSGRLKLRRWSPRDWLQPHEQSGITPLGPRAALAGRPVIPDQFDVNGPKFTILNKSSLSWSAFEFPNDALPEFGRLVADSRGYLHYTTVEDGHAVYMLSTDGGRAWSSARLPYIDGYRPVVPSAGQPGASHDQDYFWVNIAVNGRHGVTAISVRARQADTTRQFVYRFSTKSSKPELQRVYFLGDGVTPASAAITGGPRFDFGTVGLLPDGRIVASFVDDAHPESTLAVEVSEADS
jgi:hypothetical protein